MIILYMMNNVKICCYKHQPRQVFMGVCLDKYGT